MSTDTYLKNVGVITIFAVIGALVFAFNGQLIFQQEVPLNGRVFLGCFAGMFLGTGVAAILRSMEVYGDE